MAHSTDVVQLNTAPHLIADAATFLRIQNRGSYAVRILYAASLPAEYQDLGEDLAVGSVDIRADLANRQLQCWAWSAGSGTLSVERDQ
ncbi:hypothetical protein SAMN06273572_10257 [Monaibacterium marinum]|uniref:Uncharacterized protein n=1 Tax=Pontivivens marinum TaxID=1690039 RepID=A0A2C9CPD6_9RHOB|nr:hypothetical protein [Monaibacterium marinum]SOH93381.1 hypothetical protein SAMN06273572_10257 [Monaibacterium marinum]